MEKSLLERPTHNLGEGVQGEESLGYPLIRPVTTVQAGSGLLSTRQTWLPESHMSIPLGPQDQPGQWTIFSPWGCSLRGHAGHSTCLVPQSWWWGLWPCTPEAFRPCTLGCWVSLGGNQGQGDEQDSASEGLRRQTTPLNRCPYVIFHLPSASPAS